MFLCNSGFTVLFVCFLFLEEVHPFGILNSEPLAGPSSFKDFIETYSDFHFYVKLRYPWSLHSSGHPIEKLISSFDLAVHLVFIFFLGVFPFTHK